MDLDPNFKNVEIPKEIFDSSFPLLERLREEAPGTHKHSLNVSNMCDAIANELDMNRDLMRCVGVYHDIGKLFSPFYFAENQPNGENPHDKLVPYVSYLVITRHISEGVFILSEHEEFPKEVVKIISQHHGNTVMQGFYNKTKNKNDETKNKFRYHCKKPESTEASILMIVDSAEATAKSKYLKSESIDQDNFVDNVIDKTVNNLVDDGQLDNLKIGVLKVAKLVLKKELESIYHKRVSYEDPIDDKTIGELKEENDEE